MINMAKQGYTIENHGNILSVPSVELPYKQGIGTILFQKMSENKQVVGQIDAVSGKKDTYGSMLERSIRTAITIRSKCITREDIVTVCSYNHLNTNIPILASLFLGIKTASTDPTLSLSDTVFLLKQVRPKIVFVSPNAVKLIEDALSQIGISAEIVVFGHSDKHSEFSEFLVNSPEEETFRPVEITNLKETASIYFSSGTSGFPKGICLSHLVLIAQIPLDAPSTGTEQTTILTYSPPYWISSILFLITAVALKSCRLILPNFDSDQVWNLIAKYQVLMMYLAPSQLIEVVSKGRPQHANTLSLKVLPTGGSPLSEEQLRDIKSIFPTTFVAMGYGQTELGGAALTFNLTKPSELKLALEKPTSSGRPIPGRSYKIVDPDTEEILGVNQEGELRIKTEYQMNGYYNVDSSNQWDCDGFLKTGDIAYYDEDYCFYIVDRIKEMLKYRGYQISPAKLEGILMTHCAVESAVVVGLPHPADCDHPLGIVVLNKYGMDNGISEEEIKLYVDEQVDDRYKLRGGIKIVDSLPLTPTGKFSRRYTKNLVLKGKL